MAVAASFALATGAAAERPSGLYLRGGAGAVFAETLDQSLSYAPTVVGLATAKETPFDAGLSWFGAVGFQFAGGTRTELEYKRMTPPFDAVIYSGGPAPNPAAPFDENFTVQAVMSNVYFDLVNDSRLTPYVGVGVGGARVENELGERDAAFAYQGRAGVEVAVSDRLSIGAEYVYFRTLEVVYGPKEFVAGGPAGPRTDGDPFASSSVLGTVRLMF
jgi:opacity protein-like surface antigen